MREASHCTFQEIITQVGRDLAPYLKQLLGPWLVAQCDPYAPAATAAKQAFNSAFPPAKQTNALVFCKQVIIAVSASLSPVSTGYIVLVLVVCPSVNYAFCARNFLTLRKLLI